MRVLKPSRTVELFQLGMRNILLNLFPLGSVVVNVIEFEHCRPVLLCNCALKILFAIPLRPPPARTTYLHPSSHVRAWGWQQRAVEPPHPRTRTALVPLFPITVVVSMAMPTSSITTKMLLSKVDFLNPWPRRHQHGVFLPRLTISSRSK